MTTGKLFGYSLPTLLVLGVSALGFYAFLHDDKIFEDRPATFYEKKEVVVAHKSGSITEIWGIDFDKDGVLDLCSYGRLTRSWGAINFQCDLSNLPRSLESVRGRGLVSKLQGEYSAWIGVSKE